MTVTSPCSHGTAHDSLTDMRHVSRHTHSQSGKSGASADPSAASAPVQAVTWLDRYCPGRLLPFAQLIRLDKPIGEDADNCHTSFYGHRWASARPWESRAQQLLR